MSQAQDLYHLTRLWLELTRQLHQAAAPDMQSGFGSRVPLLMLSAAVYLGTIEGQPMTASKLALYVGMPRATVIRRLRTLLRRGAVERSGVTYRTPENRLAGIDRIETGALISLVKTTAERLPR